MKFMGLASGLLSCAGILAVNIGAPTGGADPLTEWLKGNVIPLKTVEAEKGLEDLQPLKAVLKDVRMIGLGEATHGTREFFQLKHRMLEFAVTELGHKMFIIEGSYTGALPINDYVLGGEGDREKLLAGMKFWTWDTEEVLALVDWMREYNKGKPEEQKIQFHGNDMQTGFEPAAPRLDKFFAKVDSTKRDEAKAVADEVLKVSQSMRSQSLSDDQKETVKKLRARAEALRDHVMASQSNYAQKSSKNEAFEALMILRVLSQFLEMLDQPMRDGSHVREWSMTDNSIDLMNSLGPNGKVVVWAHNMHVSKLPSWQGDLTARKLGKDYYTIGFQFNKGSFQAMNMGQEGKRGLIEFTVDAAPEGELGATLSKVGVPKFFLDLRSAPSEGPAAQLLDKPVRQFSLGSGYSLDKDARPKYVQSVILRQAFDGIFFLEETTRARPNRTGIR